MPISKKDLKTKFFMRNVLSVEKHSRIALSITILKDFSAILLLASKVMQISLLSDLTWTWLAFGLGL